MTIREFLHDRYAPLHQLSDRTIELYESSIRLFARHLGHEPTLDDFEDLVVSRFLQERCRGKGRSGAISRHSVKKDRTQLCAMWTLAAKKRYQKSDGSIVDFPALPPFRTPQKAPQGYLVEEVQALITYARGLRGSVGDVPAAWFWVTLYLTLWQTAGRIGEVFALTWGDVDIDGRLMRFRAETRKKQTRDVDRPIDDQLAALLAMHRGRPGDRVFNWDKKPNTRYLHMQRHCQRAGISYHGFHGIRKCAASAFQKAGGQAHELLDHHDSGELAKMHYLDPRIVGRGPSALDLLPKMDATGPEV